MASIGVASARSWLTPTGVVLILANIAPVIGVLLFEWSAFEVVVLYWAENVVIGVLNVFRMLLASGGAVGHLPGKLFIAVFFTFHYGMFTFVHGVFVSLMFAPGKSASSGFGGDIQAMMQMLLSANLGIALLVLASSHLFSFLWNYLGRREYANATPMELMVRPYGRIVVLHLTIIGGGFLVSILGSPLFGLLILVALKLLMDLAAHSTEHAEKLHADVSDGAALTRLFDGMRLAMQRSRPAERSIKKPGGDP